jgi:hypothetical protein
MLKYSVGLNIILAVIFGVYAYITFKANVNYEQEKNQLKEKYETAERASKKATVSISKLTRRISHLTKNSGVRTRTIEILEGEKVSDKAKQQISERNG